MKEKLCMFFLVSFLLSALTYAQKKDNDANLFGDVQCNGKHVPFINVTIDGTTLGTITDATGHFQLTNIPEGTYTVRVSGIGYKSATESFTATNNYSKEIKFTVEEDVMRLDEVVVSANRSELNRTEAPVIVNTLSPELFKTSQSVTLGEGLNFLPGLRLENNCQNCGFTQVRMNGLEGPYSQILINSRPVFSGLAGVYGLELIPANMIERVEVVRGGGSALFGSNAIAGTINIILKDPKTNSFEAATNYAFTGVGVDGLADAAPDYTVNFNTSLVTDDHKSGISLYGFTREREKFDANGDGFSELSPLENLTFGARVFYRFGSRDRLNLDFFSINEERNGGNKQDLPLHERDVAEYVAHDMKVAGLTYERFFRDYDMFSVYASSQFLVRDSYYGAGKSLKDYGTSNDNSYHVGAQYKTQFENASMIVGAEHTGDFLLDKKLGYRDVENPVINFSDSTVSYNHTENTEVSDQSLITSGIFTQYDLQYSKLKISVGMRFDHYAVKDLAKEGETKSGGVFSPRLSIMYNVMDDLKARVSYSQGYRAPQIFDEDLHIETSGSRKVLHVNDPDLIQETSHSIMASLDFNKLIGTVFTGFLVEGFYTRLEDAFANEYGAPDEEGTVVYTRVNAHGGANVQGVNLELKLKPLVDFELTSGFTWQTSNYEKPQEDFNEKRFFRTPDHYGYLAMDWDFHKAVCFSATANYTGSMLVPYFGTDNPDGELRTSDSFFDLGAKLSYIVKLNGTSVELTGGIKNLLNSYQDDFDRGEHRDPAYVYGPLLPRTVYFGIRFGNFLK